MKCKECNTEMFVDRVEEIENTQKIDNSIKDKFVLLVDFIFYDEEINGKTFMFLTPHEIYINEKFWDSGLSLDDFLLKFYKENNKVFFKEFVRLIDKEGNEKQISSLYVSDLYYNSLKKKEKK